jgi:hypothetical protein
MNRNDADWRPIYDHWTRCWLKTNTEPPGCEVVDIRVVPPSIGFPLEKPVFDWWPTEEISTRRTWYDTPGRPTAKSLRCKQGVEPYSRALDSSEGQGGGGSSLDCGCNA